MTARRGRRPGDPEVTRQAILGSARAAFAEHGYEKATIRAIAEGAGVDPALVHHHYGAKQELFVAAHELPISPSAIRAIVRSDHATIGQRFAGAYLGALAESEAYEALVRAAVSNEGARRMLAEFVERELLDVLAGELELPDARLRAALAAAHLVGVFMMRRIIGISIVAETPLEDLVLAVGPALDHYLTT